LKCDTCGIAESRNNGIFCVKFQRQVSEKESNNCLYYSSVTFEDGERLSALQHLVLKEIDLSSKKMKGPI
jgi:hypothetical protein